MKTAVSIPDDLFKKAEQMAKKQKVTRSRLYSAALKQYLFVNWRDDATRRANELADEIDTRLPPPMEAAALKRLRKIHW